MSRHTLLQFTLASLLALLLAAPLAVTDEETESASKEKAARATPQQVLGELTWLSGTWQGPAWGGTFTAHYSTPDGGKILSHSTLEKDGRLAFYEFEVFEPKGEVVTMQPYPGGKRVTGFQLKTSDPKAYKVVFENPKKDYPTRITYHRPTEDNLVITLSDPHGKSDKTEVFNLKRAR